MLQRIRESLTLLLIASLPFHALFVTYVTNALEGPGHAPLQTVALWKEVILLLILFVSFLDIVEHVWKKRQQVFNVDLIDLSVITLIILSFAVSMLTHGDAVLYAFGFKYDFVPLVALLLLRRVEWSQDFRQKIIHILIIVGAIVAAFGIASFTFPQDFFTALGYSDLHSLYRPDSPLPAFHQLGGMDIRRIQSTMSGPNQLGIWLLIPLSIALVSTVTNRGILSKLLHTLLKWANTKKHHAVYMHTLYLLLISGALFLSFSRSALLAALFISGCALWMLLPRAKLGKIVIRMMAPIMFGVLLLAIFFPQAFIRIASSRDHLLKPIEAMYTMKMNPFGMGLGMAGPASNRVSDSCVFLETGDDPTWAAVHPDLCVFVDHTQVQPESYECTCPFLPENWYLQIGVELGFLGFFIFLALCILVMMKLMEQKTLFSHATLFMFIGVSICGLFLHAWEDAAVAYTVWILIAVAFTQPKKLLS